MPVLPLVGSRIIVSGPILPAFSAASIMPSPMRSLTLPAGLKNSSLASTVACALGDVVQPHQRRVAHQLPDTVGDIGHSQNSSPEIKKLIRAKWPRDEPGKRDP